MSDWATNDPNALWNQFKTSHQSDYEAYKKQRNRVNKLVKIGKVKYYHEVINKDQSNPKAMWKHINN